MTQHFEAQIIEIVREYDAALNQSQYDDASDVLGLQDVAELRTRCVGAIVRITGTGSTYHKAVQECASRKDHEWNILKKQIGVTKALLYDLKSGYLTSLEEMIHGDLFTDYLEMADHLLQHKYKDAAAVLVGSTLEIHLRKLCEKNSVSVLKKGKPRKTEELNAELGRLHIYSKVDQKNVTAWLGLRNDAAHGHYSQYTGDQVRLLVASVRDFLTRYPA